MSTKLSNERQQEILDTYFKTLNVIETAKLMNTVHSTVYRLLNRKGIKLKPVSYLKDKHKDSTCFVDFEREDNSYFYGLLLADGNLSSLESRLSKIQITLKSSDKISYYNSKILLVQTTS